MIRAVITYKSLSGGMRCKTLEFKNQAHMESWKNKWFTRMGVDKFIIVNQIKPSEK